MDKDRLEQIVQTTCNVVGFLIPTGLAVDAIRNAVKGNYVISVIEGLASLYIGFEEYMRRQEQRAIEHDKQELDALSERIDRISQEAYPGIN